jgi:hypothetical protein
MAARSEEPNVRRCDDLFDNGVSQGFLAAEVIIECPFGDSGGGKDCVEAGTLAIAISITLAPEHTIRSSII